MVYLIHPIVLLLLQVAIFNVDIHQFVKFIIVAITGIALSFGVSDQIRKIPCVDKVV